MRPVVTSHAGKVVALRNAVAVGISTDADSNRAAAAACDELLGSLEQSAPGEATTFVVAISSRHHVSGAGKIASIIRRRLAPGVLVGSTAESVIGGAVEHEGSPGVAILAARLPGVRARAFGMHDLPLAYATPPLPTIAAHGGVHDGDDASDIERLAEAAGVGADHRATLLFADPFTSSLSSLLPALSLATARTECPGSILGGIASASSRPGGNALILGDRILHDGLVGLSLSGNVRIDALVSQGCRAFGEPMIVTGARGNVLKRLGGQSALGALNRAIEDLGDDEREMLRKGVFLGRVVDEYKSRFGRGDFLIRGIAGVSKDSGEIAINDSLRVGQTVQFHLRDARSATQDLELALDTQRLHSPPLGGLLFTCNGRGGRMFQTPSHDASALARLFRPDTPGESAAKTGTPIEAGSHSIPIAGMHAAGEIGPVGNTAFVHGFTACAAIIRAAEA